MKIKVSLFSGRVGYVKDVWFADDEIVGDVHTTDDLELALDVSDREFKYIKEFYDHYNATIEVI